MKYEEAFRVFETLKHVDDLPQEVKNTLLPGLAVEVEEAGGVVRWWQGFEAAEHLPTASAVFYKIPVSRREAHGGRADYLAARIGDKPRLGWGLGDRDIAALDRWVAGSEFTSAELEGDDGNVFLLGMGLYGGAE